MELTSQFTMWLGTGIAAIVWWLLRMKDIRQQESIDILFKKHDEDAKRLDDFKLEIAKLHYVKPELDAKFDKLEVSFKSGMDSLGDRFAHEITRLGTILKKGGDI